MGCLATAFIDVTAVKHLFFNNYSLNTARHIAYVRACMRTEACGMCLCVNVFLCDLLTSYQILFANYAKNTSIQRIL